MKFFVALLTIVFASSVSAIERFYPPNTTQPTELSLLVTTMCGYVGQEIDFPGSDIGSVKESTFSKCWKHCDGYGVCKAWTWTSYEGGTCWLKSGYGQAVYRAGALSGITYPSPGGNLCPHKYTVLPNCDMVGNDSFNRNVPGRGWEACVDIAIQNGYFFVWSDYNAGTCWIKYQVSPCQYAPNKYTGIFMF